MMKVKVFASLMLAGLPFILAAQSNDDLYFVPKKKTETKKETVVAPKQNSQGTTVYSTSTTSTPVVVKVRRMITNMPCVSFVSVARVMPYR